MCGIYIYLFLKNGMRYVGKTINFKNRNNSHKYSAKNNYFDNHYRKYFKEFIVDIIECDEYLLNFMELYCIFWFQSETPLGFNLSKGGEGPVGRKHTEEEIKHLREINTGENNAMYGHHHTEESRLKISRNHADVSGKNNPMYGKGKEILWLDFGLTYNSIKDLCEETGFNNSSICGACKGRYKNAYGFHFKYI